MLLTVIFSLWGAEFESTPLARLKYDGGGDWYNNPEVLPNLMEFANRQINCQFPDNQVIVEAGNADIFKYPFVYVTGHGTVKLSTKERDNLREYMLRGGFLYVDDDYGLDRSFHKEIAMIFPERELLEIPAGHPIYNSYFEFPKGLPKIHKHDDQRPRAYGIFDENGRLMLLYTYETNISDGWADPVTHNDPPEIREKALKFGVNMLYYIISG
jgi:hypothetical protein